MEERLERLHVGRGGESISTREEYKGFISGKKSKPWTLKGS